MFCNSVKYFTATFNQLNYTSWIKVLILFHKKYFWTQNIWTVKKSILYFYVMFLFIIELSVTGNVVQRI